MLSTYCQECGSKNEYTFQRPKFCGNCGAPLDSQAKKEVQKNRVAPKKIINAKKRVEEIEDEEGTDVYEVPDITNFEYEVEYDQPRDLTLGSFLPKMENEAPKKRRGRPRKNASNNAKKKKS